MVKRPLNIRAIVLNLTEQLAVDKYNAVNLHFYLSGKNYLDLASPIIDFTNTEYHKSTGVAVRQLKVYIFTGCLDLITSQS